MPAATGQPFGDIGGILGIVEDQQPPAPVSQFGQHRRPQHRSASPGMNASQLSSEGGELVTD